MNISEVFPGATVSLFDLTIPSGSLISSRRPVASNGQEIVFGMLENISSAVASGNAAGSLTNVTVSTSEGLLDSTTYQKQYTFAVRLDFDSSNIIEDLNVKSEPVE